MAERHATELFGQAQREGFARDGDLRVVILGVTEESIRSHARAAAYERLEHEVAAGGLKKRIWQGNIAYEYFATKYAHEARGHIIAGANLFATSKPHAETDKETGKTDAPQAQEYEIPTMTRFAHLGAVAVRKELGETYQELSFKDATGGQGQTEPADIASRTFQLIARHATGEASDDTLEAELRALYDKREGSLGLGDYVGDTGLAMDNVREVIQTVRKTLERGDGTLGEIKKRMRLVIGRAAIGVPVEVPATRSERIAYKLTRRPWVNEATLATAVSLVYSFAGWAGKSAVGAVTRWVAPGAAAGAWAGLREYGRFTRERAHLTRKGAQGESVPDSLENKYALRPLHDYIALQTSVSRVAYKSDERLRGDKNYIDYAMRAIARADVAEYFHRQRIASVRYTAPEKVDSENVYLLIAADDAKRTVRKFIESLSAEELTAYYVEPQIAERIRNGKDITVKPFDALYEEYVRAELADSRRMYERFDRRFQEARREVTTKAAAVGAIAGMAVGLVAQELLGLVLPQMQSLVEHAFGLNEGAPRDTLLNSLTETHHHVVHALATKTSLSSSAAMDIPQGWHAAVSGHELTLSGPDHETIRGLQLNHNGTLTTNALHTLRSHGFMVGTSTGSHSVPTQVTQQVDAQTFMQQHGVAEHTDGWLANDTTSPNLNERDLLVFRPSPTGPITIDISHMTPGGSFQNGVHVDWQQAAAAGKLKVFMSATQGTHGQSIELPMGSSGQLTIPTTSEAAQLFDAHGTFVGDALRVDYVTGTSNGVVHTQSLATALGSGKNSFVSTVTVPKTIQTTTYHLAYTPVAHRAVAVPLVVPIRGRRSMYEQAS